MPMFLIWAGLKAGGLEDGSMSRETANTVMSVYWFFGTLAVGLAVLALLGFGKREGNAGTFLAILAILIGSLGSMIIPNTLSGNLQERRTQQLSSREFANIQRLAAAGKHELALVAADAIVQRDDTPRSYLERARVRRRSGDLEGALQDLSKAVEKAPKSTDYLWERIDIQLTQGQYEAVLTDTNRLLELTPAGERDRDQSRTNCWVVQAQALLSLGRNDQARDAALNATMSGQPTAGAFNLLGLSQINLGESEAAIANLERAVAINPNMAAAWSNLGLAYFNLGRTALAIEKYRRAVELDSNLAVAWNSLMTLKFQAEPSNSPPGSSEKAITRLTEQLESDESNAAFWRHRGIAYLIEDQIELAIADLTHSLELDSQQPTVCFYVGKALAQKKNWIDAIKYFNTAIELDPDYVDAYFQKAIAFVAVGDQKSKGFNPYDHARDNLIECIKRSPNNPRLLLELAEVHQLDGNRQDAITVVTQFLELVPGDAVALEKRANLFFETKNYNAALADCDTLVQTYPDDPSKKLLRASSLIAMKRYDDAIEQAKSVSANHPENLAARRILGNCHYQLKHYDEALESYAEALKIQPQDMVSLSSRGHILGLQGHFDQSAAEYEKQVDLQPGQFDPRYFLAHALAGDHQWDKFAIGRSALLNSLEKTADPQTQMQILRLALLGPEYPTDNHVERMRILVALHEANPNYSGLGLLHGAYLIRADKFKEAESMLRDLLDKVSDPKEIASIRLWLSQAEAKLEKTEAGKATFEIASQWILKHCGPAAVQDQVIDANTKEEAVVPIEWWQQVELQSWLATATAVVQ